MSRGGGFDDFIIRYDAVSAFFSLPPCSRQVRSGQVIAPVNLYFQLMRKFIFVKEISIGEQLWTNECLPSTYGSGQRLSQGTVRGAQREGASWRVITTVLKIYHE